MTDGPKKKRKKPVSMTAKARALCRENGWVYGQVDQRIPTTFIARDLFEMFDAIVLDGQKGILGVQVTSGANHAARRAKILGNPLARSWLDAGGRIAIWSWRKLKPQGQRAPLYRQRIEAVELDSFADAAPAPADASSRPHSGCAGPEAGAPTPEPTPW